MADDPIKSFMVSLGFTGDAAGAKKVVDLANSTEAAITKAAEGGASDRVEAENNASNERIGIIKALGKIFVAQEEDRTKREEKIKKDAAARDEKLEQERERKAKERRAAAVKDLQAHATRMATFALKAVGAVEAAALGIVYATERAAKGFERLNYVSQRAGSTPGKTTAVGYAFSQLGGQAADGESAVSAVGGRLKENPAGYSAALKSIGVEARKANGEMRDTADIVTDLGEALARIRKQGGQYGYAQAKARGVQFGLDEGQTQTLMDPRFRAMEAEGAAIDAKAGADRDKAGAGGTAFEQSFRRLEQMADAIRTKISTNLFAALTPELDKLAKWADEHGEQVAKWVDRAATDIIAFARAVSEQLAKVPWDDVLGGIERFAGAFQTTTEKYFGENGPIIATLAIFGTLIGAKVLGPLNLVLGALTRIGGLPLVGRLLGGAVGSTAGLTAAAVTVGAVSNAEMARRTGQAMTSGDPNAKFDPATGFVNDLDFGYGKDKQEGGSNPKTGAISWLKGLFGFNSSDPDARKVKDAIVATAEGVKKLADKQDGMGGVTASSGGLGGSGQHFGGSSPGASLGDRAHGRRGTGVGSASGIQSDAGAPGANGFGTIDAPYRASVDAKGERGILSPRELFGYLKSHGATDNEATMLTGAAGNESSFNPNAVHDGGNGYGMWGHNIHDRIDMRGMTWQQQADAALAEAKRDYAGRINGARTPQELADAEMHYERPRGYHSNNPRGGDNYTGRLHTIDRFARTFGTLGNAAVGSGGSTSESVGEKIAGMKSAGLLTDEQCVTLAMASVGVRKGSGEAGANVHDWRKGDGADAGTLKPGTPVATFLNRDGSQSDRYAGGGAGTPGAHLDHAGVFQKYVLDAYGKRIGMTLLEQYQGSRGAHLKDYLFGKGSGEGNGSNYHAVLGPDGRPLGMGRNPMTPVHVEVTDKSAAKIGRGIGRKVFDAYTHGDKQVGGLARSRIEAHAHLAATQAVLRAHRGHILGVDPHSMLGRHIRNSIDNSRRQVSMIHNPTYNIHGVTDTGAAMGDAHRMAGRGQADLVRNMSVMTA